MRIPIALTVTFLLFNTGIMAQTKVDAAEVIGKINKGEAVEYRNVRISGDLDLTRLANQTVKSEGNKNDPDTVFINTVTVPLLFADCIFEGKVIGYFNPDAGKDVVIRTSRIYNTNFDKDVLFKNCTFEQEANFKYSEFKGVASFNGSTFRGQAFFKYTAFSKAPDFGKSRFTISSFKYVHFPTSANFEGCSFSGEADFKYARFSEGANFRDARFDSYADFKYANLKNPVLQNAVFRSSADFKHTVVNNRQVPLTALTGN